MKRKRNRVYLALKKSPIGGIDEELRVLNTDCVDILLPPLHSVNDMDNQDLPGAFEKLKKEGKIRFSGFACHSNVPDVMTLAVGLGFFDVVLVAYNLANRGQLDPIPARAKEEQNTGFMAMKATKDVDREAPGLLSSAFVSLLQNPHVDTLLVGMASFANLEKNVEVSGRGLAWTDRFRLREVAHLAASACAMCGGESDLCA